MLQPIIGAGRSGGPVRQSLRVGFILSLNLLILVLSTRTTCLSSDLFQISAGPIDTEGCNDTSLSRLLLRSGLTGTGIRYTGGGGL